MLTTQAVVIGAGPAGAVAACKMASAGLQVILVDQAKFPRDKTCGDGVTYEGLKLLNRIGLGDWAAKFPTYQILRLTSPDGQILDVPVEVPPGECYGRTIPRRLLDAQLLQAALDAGARLLDGHKVNAIDISGDKRAVVSVGDKNIEADLVILAEGSHATLARRLGLVHGQPDMLAYRQYLAGDSGPRERLEIHFQKSVLPGYNWFFPLGEGRANVGVFTLSQYITSKKVDLGRELQRFLSDPIHTGRLANRENVGQAKGHPLRTQFGKKTHDRHLLIAGDTAGLVSPLSGEGIAAALLSGELAAHHAQSAFSTGEFSARALNPYSQALCHQFKPDHVAALFLRRIFNHPWFINRLFQRLSMDKQLALFVALVIVGKVPTRQAVKPGIILRLLGKK